MKLMFVCSWVSHTRFYIAMWKYSYLGKSCDHKSHCPEAYEGFRNLICFAILPLCNERHSNVRLMEVLDVLPQTLTFPIKMTLSGQSDQKLGTLAVRVKFSISEFAWILIYCCCYDLGRGSVVVERVVWGSSENYLSERCFEILSGSHLRVAWYVKSLSKQNYCYPLFFPVSHKRFMAVWWLGDIWSYGSCWGRGRMKRYLHREMQCLTNISRLTTAHRTMKHSTWNTLL